MNEEEILFKETQAVICIILLVIILLLLMQLKAALLHTDCTRMGIWIWRRRDHHRGCHNNDINMDKSSVKKYHL